MILDILYKSNDLIPSNLSIVFVFMKYALQP